MRLQMATRCALFALAELAGQPAQPVSAGAIAGKYGLSLNHLAKVLTALAHAGLVEPVRGAGGGYRFAGDPHRTTLMDVIRLFEPMDAELSPATPEAAALSQLLASIEDRARAPFAAMTLEEMLRLSGR